MRARLGWRVLTDEGREDYAYGLVHLIAQVEYWTEVRNQQIADGVTPGHSKDTVSPGDFVKIRNMWCYVLRANAKSVSVPNRCGGSWNDTSPWQEVQDVVKPGTDRHEAFVAGFLKAEAGNKFGAMVAKRFPEVAAKLADSAKAAPQAETQS